eukprot:COSAG02_NODE_15130_length_1201_cov_1.355717_2_plen_91_part_00
MKAHGINPASGVDVLAEMIGDDEFVNDDNENASQPQPQQKPKLDSWDTTWDSSDWGEADPGSASPGWEEEVQWSTDLSKPASSAAGGATF